MAKQLTPKVSWVGKVDWELTRFHGSYGWSGDAVKQINALLTEAGFALVNEGIAKLWVPDESNLDDCREYGRAFAQAL